MAIEELIENVVSVFMENEDAILNGDYHTALLDKSTYKVQIKDIIKISVKNIYQSQEVLNKEIMGYKILTKVLDDSTIVIEHDHGGETNSFDKLTLKNFLKDFGFSEAKLGDWLVDICSHIASLRDSNALRAYRELIESDF